MVDSTSSLPVSPHVHADRLQSVDDAFPYLPVSPTVHTGDLITVDAIDNDNFHLDEDIPIGPDNDLVDLSADAVATTDSMMATLLGEDPSGSTAV